MDGIIFRMFARAICAKCYCEVNNINENIMQVTSYVDIPTAKKVADLSNTFEMSRQGEDERRTRTRLERRK